ncbi:hypothetical protein KR222_009798, partial [Zaprionus bogoriensis]
MDALSISQRIYIKRSDGRVHLARIVKLDGSAKQSVTVEWIEGKTTRGKEVPLDVLIPLNPHIFMRPTATTTTLSAMATSSTPRRQTHAVAHHQGIHSVRRSNANCYVMPRLTAGNPAAAAAAAAAPAEVRRRLDVHQSLERLRQRRERRRQLHVQVRERQLTRRANPSGPHMDTVRLLRQHRLEVETQLSQDPAAAAATASSRSGSAKQRQILVCVRKRPLNERELQLEELDVISVPRRELLVVHEPRKQVNLTRFVNNHKFRFDHTFDESCSNAEVYEHTARPLVRHVLEGGNATCFAFGQTGSGKTHTMGGEFTGRSQNSRDGIYALAADDFFRSLEQPQYAHLGLSVGCSFFELYGTRVYDLLMPGKPQLRVLEDGQRQVRVVGLTEEPVASTEDVLALLEQGNSVRTSGQTSANARSSRSHAIFQLVLRRANVSQRVAYGKFSLIDLAGNERGADNCSADRLTRQEGSDINKSLLALKECIRAMDRQQQHLPFRGSKLTHVLRDSFVGGRKVRTCMIATISPGLKSVEHTLNTLRYADRVKGLT